MSRHSKWHSIKHKKGVADKKRAKIFTRHGNLIALAARQGGDPSMNPALRLAIENAKKDNFPGGNIDRAIQRGSGEGKEGSRLEEILYEGYGPGGVAIVVQCVTDNRNRTIALLDAIIEAGLDSFEFTGGVRADTLNEIVAGKMVRAGFKRVTLGVESGSPRMLKMVRKGETNEDVKRAMDLLRDAGIKSHAFFMIGLPGETPEDIELSKDLIREVRPDHVDVPTGIGGDRWRAGEVGQWVRDGE